MRIDLTPNRKRHSPCSSAAEKHLFLRLQIIYRDRGSKQMLCCLKPLSFSMFKQSLFPSSNANCCLLNTLCRCLFSIVLLWMLLPPQLKGHNCALDTPSWQFEAVRRTLQAWLDTQKKGNITAGQTGDVICA